jgi:hypothetical protein
MEAREQDVRDDRVGGLAVELEVWANPDNRIPIRIKPSAPPFIELRRRSPPATAPPAATHQRASSGSR